MLPDPQKMPENVEEKEKCLEKLNQMQKFLPFLDFMIDKIKKKNNKISLECQLSKFQLLRSMIAEKSRKYNWDAIVKVEDVIEKLISKLDFKEQYEKPKENLARTDSEKTKMKTSVSIVPSAANSSSPQVMTTDSKSQDLVPGNVDVIMKTLKPSSGGSGSKSTQKGTELPSNPSDAFQLIDISGKTMDTDLDKDLDGFDLMDCPNALETDPRLNTSKKNCPTSSAGDKTEKASDTQTVSAFSRSQTSADERKSKSDFSESDEKSPADKNIRKSLDAQSKTSGKQNPVSSKSCKTFSSSDKPRTDPVSNLKQKLKEKLSTDICEVYRVPGKSVGGSLRGLKDSKDHKKGYSGKEEESVRSGKSSENGVQKRESVSHSRSSTDKNQTHRSHRDSSGSEKRGEKNTERDSHKNSSSGKSDKKYERNSKNGTSKSHKTEYSGDKTQEKKSDSKISKDGKRSPPKSEKNFDVHKLNDFELSDFVKENVKSLPHLARLKPGELRKALQSSLSGSSSAVDADGISEISDDSFQDVEEIPVEKKDSRGGSKDKTHRTFESGSSGSTKNAKSSTKPKKEFEIVDLVDDLEDVSMDESLDEDAYALKLIEETTIKTYPKKKKEALVSNGVDTYKDISCIENFGSPASSGTGSVSQESKNKGNKQESVPQPVPDKPAREVLGTAVNRPTTIAPKESPKPSNPQDVPKTQRSNEERTDPRLNRSLSSHGSPDPSQPLPKPPKLIHINDPRRHSSSSEPKSYGEYKRLKLKEQEKGSKDGSRSSFPGGSKVAENRSSTEGEKPREEQKDAVSKQNNPKSLRTYEARKCSNPKSKKAPDQVESKEKSEEPAKINEEKGRKSVDEKRHVESEDIVSPLEELYRNEAKPKTGRGYGIQNFKIPKKGWQSGAKEPGEKQPPNSSVGGKNDSEGVSAEAKKLETSQANLNGSSVGEYWDEPNSNVTKIGLNQTNPSHFSLEEYRDGDKSSNVSKAGTGQVMVNKTSLDENLDEPNSNVTKTGRNQVNVVEAIVQENSDDARNSSRNKIKTEESSPDDVTDSSVTKDNSSRTSEKVESTTESAKTDNSIKENSSEMAETGNKTKQTDAPDESGSFGEESVPAEVTEIPDSKNDSRIEKTEESLAVSKKDEEEKLVTVGEGKAVAENVKKCETQLAECDSSMESSSLNEQSCGRESASSSEKSTALPKEDITQELMEALIRKSFQSGEGKLLLAQVKLFEEFARKLNFKKLKTIQKIINSESDSSSSTSESSSEDDKKRRKSKKRKKKGRKSRKHKTFSSSSSSEESESEETSEEESCDKREKGRRNEGSGDGEERLLDTSATSEESKSKGSEFSGGKTKGRRRRRNAEFGRHFSRRKAKRKQKQKKLLEKILNEAPKPETSNDSVGADGDAKDSEPKSKPRTKGKCKTELDRLHDDIRSMFISDGVVTATGKRMCRILKQSGGDMNDLDIVKESAKMVEEEKLKKMRTRSSQRNSRLGNAGSSENRSRSQSLDKGAKVQAEAEDPKLGLEPRVCLQRVDLDNFGYGVKISDDCISFRRMQGRNTAIRGVGMPETSSKNPPKESSSENITRGVFLARNKRKFERLKDSKCKKGYTGKKLMDVVQNLPLKMAKMKHLQFCERKIEKDTKHKVKAPPGKCYKGSSSQRSEVTKADFSNVELLQYAFEKKRKVYSCKLCFQVTRHITMHYKEAHPDHEVLISRLSLLEAEKAKLDAKSCDGDTTGPDKNHILGTMKRNMKALMNRSAPHNCRMCRASNIEGMNDFATHVSGHTGEFRFKCPAEDCTMQFFSRQDIKFHILTKHTKNRSEFYGKITELYHLTIEGNQLLGFLCPVCNFVQLNRRNLEDHITRQHDSSNSIKILKINMSDTRSEKFKKKPKTGPNAANGAKNDDSRNDEEESEVSDDNGRGTTKRKASPEEGSNADGKETAESEAKKMKISPEYVHPDESQSSESVDMQEKKLVSDDNGEVGETKGAEETEVNLEGNENSREDVLSSDSTSNDVDMEDCVDLKRISTLKGSDIIESLEKVETRDSTTRINPETSGECVKLKVGPLEARLFKNSEVLYECYVKGCLFSTRLTNLFERHIEISHIRTKWSGTCEICSERGDTKPSVKKPTRLVTALRHLKLHEREEVNGGRLSPEDLILRAKLLTRSDSTGDEEELESTGNKVEDPSDVRQEESPQPNSESSDNPYPAKPLLRVRNFLGDRLSTPKACDSDGGKAAEDGSPSEDTSKMFTIENVRSLQKAPGEDSELKIEQVCSLKDQLPKAAAQLGPGKTIIVRSCPTRKIAIRPETGAVAVEGGHINVVQPPVVAHPVVLSPLSGSSPIRIISAALSPKPKFTVKPIMVPADSVRISGSHGMPVIRPTLSTSLKATTVIPVTSTGEIISSKPNEGNSTSTQTGGSPLHVDLYTPQMGSGSPSTPTTSVQVSNSPSDMEEPEEKDTIVPQKMPSNLGTGKKSLKDVKIYQEMLTKTKLCHFFKCMGIECSFTCDDENVFMQHIGLHEVQRRMNRNKGVKTIYLRMANRMTRAFYWQQCAYCCEVLNNSISALSQHVREEHGHCMYQCAFCFYRAVSHSYVKLHQNLAHSQLLKTAPRLIYKCKPLKPAPTLAAALEKHGRRQSVRPYHCDQCGMKFFITEDFITHLASEHQSVTAYTCHICKNLCFKINRLINHYKLHSYSTYQCPYCIHGTETEKEMVFHLCNFHFSQPAVMYVRALADGQSDDEIQKPSKKKKPLSNQLDSLKVIVYESDNLNLDCIVEVDPDDNTGNNSEASSEVNSIAAELGITTESESSTPGVTPLMKELASIGEKGAKNITVKTLLPNAQFSSEGEKGTENCSVLISSGLSIPSDQNEEREMSIPLGQLPLEAVNVQHKEPAPPPPPPPSVESPDRNLKLNELIVNLQQKEKSLALAHSTDEDKIIKPSTVILSSAVHKLPPVVLTRNASKNMYPSKCMVVKRKAEEPPPKPESEVVRVYQIVTPDGKEKAGGNGQGKVKGDSSGESEISKTSTTQTEPEAPQSNDHPLITKVVSLANSEFDKEEESRPSDNPIVISDICSLSSEVKNENDNPEPSSGVVINIKSKVSSPSVLRPPIIRVEDFPIEESSESNPPKETAPESKETTKEDKQEEESPKEESPPSPDVIILEEEKTKNIVTVTLDSDDEKDENGKKKGKGSKEGEGTSGGNETIRKEIERLRKQIANETDSLLLDEPESAKPSQNLTLNIKPSENEEDAKDKGLLSPIEEAICTLNKKLQSETEQAQKKGEEDKKVKDDKSQKWEEEENKVQERRRTRFGARERKKEAPESDGDEGVKKEDTGKKKFKEELTGKELFVCGNEKCTFAADDDSMLKDHLFVCDLSRESTVLVCPHCSRQIKQLHAYLEHLKYHGEKKYHCGLCSFSSAVDQGVSRHVKQKHKCSLIKVLPKESKEGHLLYYPKNYKVERVDFEVNGYSPGDEDKLPLQSVYQVNVKCAKCPYFTKVRSNMVRHLKIHVKSVETEGVVVVPSTAPTNPVPCLETKERMFDKMTNLAASSQLAQARERAAVESLSPEEEAKLPQFVPEQMRYKCCLPDCNYITVDDGMLKHHIKALHDEISYYSCPHCQSTVHTDIRHVTLDKIGFHLKHHDTKLYKCAHCIFFHYQKNVVEKHTADKHPERRYFLHTVREPKVETAAEEEPQNVETGARVWKCGLCDSFQTPSKPTLMDHLIKTHNTKSKYKCRLCALKGNSHQVFVGHFASKHPGEKVSYVKVYFSDVVPTNSLIESQSGNSSGADSSNEHFDTTPLWQRGAPRVRHIRGILIEEEEIKTKKTKRMSVDESDGEMSDASKVKDNAFYCPLCTNKKKPFYTRSESFFRTHLYQELNYQQFACILCGKMFVDRRDFERHHSRLHPDKEQVLKQTKEDHEIKFWVDRVIAKRKKEMEDRKRKLSDGDGSESPAPPKKIKEV